MTPKKSIKPMTGPRWWRKIRYNIAYCKWLLRDSPHILGNPYLGRDRATRNTSIDLLWDRHLLREPKLTDYGLDEHQSQ